MKLRLCIALFGLALLGGLATAALGAAHPALADSCGGYACAGND